MCFIKKVSISNKIKNLLTDFESKFYDFKDYIRDNNEYEFLRSTKWYYDIEIRCDDFIRTTSTILYEILSDPDESDYKLVLQNYADMIKKIDEAKSIIPDTIAIMKKNSKEFEEFCQKSFSRFFVLTPLFGGQRLYCFSCEKEMFNKIKYGDSGLCYLDVTLINTLEKKCFNEVIYSTDYSIRKMDEDEFQDIYLPLRCEKIGFSNEIELINYEEGLNKLFIEDSIRLKMK